MCVPRQLRSPMSDSGVECAPAHGELRRSGRGGVRWPWMIVGVGLALVKANAAADLVHHRTGLIVALAAANVYQAVKPGPAVAKVNGAAISRKDYDKAVAAQDGQQVLDNLINDRLVKQDAAKKHVSVSTDEVDAKLKEIKGQIGTEEQYKQALSAQHITELSLRDSIRNFLLLQKLTADRNQVSDADVQTAYSQGKDTEYQGKSLDDVKDQIKSQLTQDKQQQAQSSYLDDLKKNAKISLHIPGA